MNYYNEFDPAAAQWIRNLIDADLIPRGHVDDRSIEDVTPNDIAGYTQHHFFAGIAGWSLALAAANYPATAPIWTASCPCQPFSASGKGDGFADERHVWPAFHWLVQQCRPSRIVGEQVASKLAESWIDLVLTDLEALGFAVAAVAFPAAGVGAPHIRDRTYWLGDADNARLEGLRLGHRGKVRYGEESLRPASTAGEPSGMADSDGGGQHKSSLDRAQADPEHDVKSHCATGGGMGDPNCPTGEREPGAVLGAQAKINSEGSINGAKPLGLKHASEGIPSRPGPTNGAWRAADWLACRDGRWRPVEPGSFPLAHGVPARVVRLRAYGNAINIQQAAEFLKAAL